MQVFCKWLFRLIGWKIVGKLPDNHAKLLILVAPHTSNWDLLIALLVKYILKVKVHFAAKKSLFRGPFNYFFSKWGGIPVDRSEGNSSVQQIVDFINQKDQILFALAPEGSRKKVDKLKSGFYRIAKDANMLILLVTMDYGSKELKFGELFSVKEKSKDEVLHYVTMYFKGIKGKIEGNAL